MQRIVCDTTFLDGTDRFEKGDVRTVDRERALRFVEAGWAHAEGTAAAEPAAQGALDLQVQSAVIGQEVRNG